MPYFKDVQNKVYFYRLAEFAAQDLLSITAEEAETIRLASIPPTPPVILTCTPWQMRKALNQLGLRTAVENYVASSDQTTKDGWEFATEFRENDSFVVAAQTALGMTDADRINLFNLARSL